MKEKIYTVKEVAKLLGYSTNTIYGYLRTGEIKSLRMGRGKFRIPESELARLEGSVKSEDTLTVLPEPRPGKSLEALSGETPWHILKLWLAERVGLPRLFDWMVSLSSIVLGMSMFLYNRQMDVFVAGNLSDWFIPIRLSLIVAGFGLILADMIQDEFPGYRHLNNIFRLILVVTCFALAFMQMRAGDADGLIINGLFGFVILLEALFGLVSSVAYAMYVGGLAVGILWFMQYFPSVADKSSIYTAIYRVIDGYSVLLYGIAVFVLLALIWGFFTSKRLLLFILGFLGLLLVTLSMHYASDSNWARAFFVLIIALTGILLPFWEDFKYRSEEDRTMMFRMFGGVLMTFFMAIAVIGIVQSTLLRSARQNLADKADYGKSIVDNAIVNTLVALYSLSDNEIFRKALVEENKEVLNSLSQSLYKNHEELENMSIVDGKGEVIVAYPNEGDRQVDYKGMNYLRNVKIGENSNFSGKVQEYPFGGKNTVVVGVDVRQPDGKIIGGVYASYKLKVLGDRLGELASEPLGQHFGLLDKDGEWLSNVDENLVGSKVAETDITYLSWLTNKEFNIGYNGSGRYSMVAIKAVKNVNWTVTVAQPVFAVLDVGKSGQAIVLVLLFATVVIAASSYAITKNPLLKAG